MHLDLIRAAIVKLEDDHDGLVEDSLRSYLETLDSELTTAGFEPGIDLLKAKIALEDILNELEDDEDFEEDEDEFDDDLEEE
jgi:hypothetical protein